MSECQSFGIGTSSVNIIELRNMGIPVPDEWSFVPYSRVETCGDGTRKGFGTGVATWKWDILTQLHVNKLLDYITGDEASAALYISTATDRGGSAQTFDDYSAIFDRITDGQGKTLFPRTSRPVVYQNVTASFTHLVEA